MVYWDINEYICKGIINKKKSQEDFFATDYVPRVTSLKASVEIKWEKYIYTQTKSIVAKKITLYIKI